MPLPRPILDNRSFEQLRDELIRRIPTYAPEWTDHNPSDPGIALIELFSFLGENLLFQFNQIPEATQLAYLQLLQMKPRPPFSARGLVGFSRKDLSAALVKAGREVQAGAVSFETRTEVVVLPISVLGAIKESSPPPDPEATSISGREALSWFEQFTDAAELQANEVAVCYQTALLANGPLDVAKSVDGQLWVALLAPDARPETLTAAKRALVDPAGRGVSLNIGFSPRVRLQPQIGEPTPEQADADRASFACAGDRAGAGVEWRISAGGDLTGGLEPRYLTLDVSADTTNGLSQEGVVRLVLPRREADFGAFVVEEERLGTRNLPPNLDDPELEARLLVWLQAFRPNGSSIGVVEQLASNVAEVVQELSEPPAFLGTGTGQPGLSLRLPSTNVVPGSLDLEVEEGGWRSWTEVESFHLSREFDRHYTVDHLDGLVQFGNGIQGWIPQAGQRVRVRSWRHGGGVAGNLPAGSISTLSARGRDSIEAALGSIDVTNALPTYGGAEAEPVGLALERIPGELRRHDRAVTAGDFEELALATPGADIGRAECLARVLPNQPGIEVPGAVTVVIWPREDTQHPDAPVPDRRQLDAVCRYLDQRRLITTELVVMPARYRDIAVSVGVHVKQGFGTDAVRRWVELALRRYLAPLPPHGPEGGGWPLGRPIRGSELEAAAVQVEGVEFLEPPGLRLSERDPNGAWRELRTYFDTTTEQWVSERVELLQTQVPRVAEITVVIGPPLAPGDRSSSGDPGQVPVPIPRLRDEC